MEKETTRSLLGMKVAGHAIEYTAIGRRIHKRLARQLGMAQEDPLIRAAKKAYRSSLTGKLDTLFTERTRWLRKQTIATNKLQDVENRIRMMLVILIQQIEGPKPKPESAEKGTSNEKA